MSVHSASAVGNKFVVSYYTYLSQEPQLLQNFYKNNSVITHGSEATFGTPEETVTGVEEINKKIQKLDFRDTKVTLSVVDCQASHNGGILILVVGNLSNKGEPSRKFVQTFFLAEQNKGLFFVLNDVFRYLEESKISVAGTESSNVEPNTKTQTTKQEEPKPKESNVVPSNNSQDSSPKTTPKQQPPLPIETTPSSAPIKKESITKQSVPPTKKVSPPTPPEEKEVPSGPKSWSNVASTSSSSKESTTTNNPPPPHAKRTTPPPAQHKTNSAPRKEDKSTPISSLFVSNVPFGATPEQIRVAFAKFGEIKDMNIISNKGYVFLELSSVEEAQKAIQSAKQNELVLDGRIISVEERRPRKEGSGFTKDRSDRPFRSEDKQRGERPKDRGEKKPSNGKPPREQHREKEISTNKKQ